MREQSARLIYPVFRRGLLLKERLRHGQLHMAHEQAELIKLIKAADGAIAHGGATRGMGDGPGEAFLGVGYPLACWLDEIFIRDPTSPWKDLWREKTLELALYGSRARAYRFWEQAKARNDPDVLEVFYLCVMLGFRGDPVGNRAVGGAQQEGAPPDDSASLLPWLQEWRQTVELLLGQGQAVDWPDKPPELPLPPPDVPPRRARERLLWVLLAYAFVGGTAILLTAYSVLSLL